MSHEDRLWCDSSHLVEAAEGLEFLNRFDYLMTTP
jgi:hypothetical protein